MIIDSVTGKTIKKPTKWKISSIIIRLLPQFCKVAAGSLQINFFFLFDFYWYFHLIICKIYVDFDICLVTLLWIMLMVVIIFWKSSNCHKNELNRGGNFCIWFIFLVKYISQQLIILNWQYHVNGIRFSFRFIFLILLILSNNMNFNNKKI